MRDAERTEREISIHITRLLVMMQWRQGKTVEFRAKNQEEWRTATDPQWEPGWNWEQTEYRIRKE